jgi:hypothetical protein
LPSKTFPNGQSLPPKSYPGAQFFRLCWVLPETCRRLPLIRVVQFGFEIMDRIVFREYPLSAKSGTAEIDSNIFYASTMKCSGNGVGIVRRADGTGGHTS